MNEISKALDTLSKSFKSITGKNSNWKKEDSTKHLEECKLTLTAQEMTHLFLEKLLLKIKECQDLIDLGDSDEMSDSFKSIEYTIESHVRQMYIMHPEYYKNFLHTTLPVLESSIEEQIEAVELDIQLNLTEINRIKKVNTHSDNESSEVCDDVPNQTEG